jgi:hypothetical protein
MQLGFVSAILAEQSVMQVLAVAFIAFTTLAIVLAKHLW